MTIFQAKCQGGPLDGQVLASGGPRRTFLKPQSVMDVVVSDQPVPITATTELAEIVAGYYDFDYKLGLFVWTDA